MTIMYDPRIGAYTMAVQREMSQKGCYYCRFQPNEGMWEATGADGAGYDGPKREILGYYKTKEEALAIRRAWEVDVA